MSIKPAGLPASHFEKLEKYNPDLVGAVLFCSKLPWTELVQTLTDKNDDYDDTIRQLMLTQYVKCGKKHFHLNEDLTWLLSQTRADVMFDHLMPFQCVYLSFGGELDCSLSGGKFEGVYISRNRTPREPDRDGEMMMDFIICFGVRASQHFQYVVTPGQSIKYGDWLHKIEYDGSTVSRRKVVDLISLTLNALLYISTPTAVRYKPSEVLTDKQKKRVRKSPRRKRQLEKLDQSVVILGPEARASRISRTPHQGGTVRSHLRRGHWRRQWVGSKLDQDGNKRLGEKQVPLWVLPTWVSGDGEPAVKTKYIVK
ncbi:hypothetical protein [uncultured Mediterranean phage uvMED]|nr:hypothetical protein [uncultured Mediterranean phage uvMED]